VRLLAVLASPVIPTSAATVLDALGAPAPSWPRADALAAELQVLAPGHPVAIPPVLFAKITDDQQAELVERFGGPEGSSAS
jgi:methionyl-tRNA synthetase